jgi:hypothetical protein
MARLQYAVDSPHIYGWAERIGRIIMNSSALELESVHWLVQMTERHEDAGFFFIRPSKRGLLRSSGASSCEAARTRYGVGKRCARGMTRVAWRRSGTRWRITRSHSGGRILRNEANRIPCMSPQ